MCTFNSVVAFKSISTSLPSSTATLGLLAQAISTLLSLWLTVCVSADLLSSFGKSPPCSSPCCSFLHVVNLGWSLLLRFLLWNIIYTEDAL